MADFKKVKKSIKCCLKHPAKCEKCYYEGCCHKHGGCKEDLLADALELLKEQSNGYVYLMKQFCEVQDQLFAKPDVVRCKECIHWNELKNHLPFGKCGLVNGPILEPDFFCADGVKEEKE